MPVLADLRDLDDLQVTAALPKSAIAWMDQALTADHIHQRWIRSSSGKVRTVFIPTDDSLERLQKRLKEFLGHEIYIPHPSVHGYVKRRSAYTNASAHLGAPAILTVDIREFFSSISAADVKATLLAFGATANVARGITNVTTFKNQLATGFSTSSVLSNMYFFQLDVIFSVFARGLGLTYTRYADDLTFSGDAVGDNLLVAVSHILRSQGLQLNDEKVRFLRRGHPQFVTGYSVDHSDHPRLSRYFKRKLRQDLYYTNRFGIDHQAQVLGIEPESLALHLLGRINYLMSAERDLARSLHTKYEHLLNTDNDSDDSFS